MLEDDLREARIGFDHEIDSLFDQNSDEPVTNATMHEFAEQLHGLLVLIEKKLNQ